MDYIDHHGSHEKPLLSEFLKDLDEEDPLLDMHDSLLEDTPEEEEEEPTDPEDDDEENKTIAEMEAKMAAKAAKMAAKMAAKKLKMK